MILTFFFAQFFGLLFVVLSVSMLKHKRMYLHMLTMYREERASIYPLSFVGLVIGLVLVLTHSVWHGTFLQVLITVIGWAFFLKCTVLLTLPTSVLNHLMKHFDRKNGYRVAAIALLIVGIYLFVVGTAGR
ncbi:MAG: hypothetical protein JWN64_801 [Parcubacteria group bacterium]|nr:hypothetical protein [Parcubacteria group bacterium]